MVASLVPVMGVWAVDDAQRAHAVQVVEAAIHDFANNHFCNLTVRNVDRLAQAVNQTTYLDAEQKAGFIWRLRQIPAEAMAFDLAFKQRFGVAEGTQGYVAAKDEQCLARKMGGNYVDERSVEKLVEAIEGRG